MAKIKITESEIRSLIKRVIKETTNMQSEIVETEIENAELLNGEIASFGLSANITKYSDGEYDINKYKLAQDSYNPQLKKEIEEWVMDNQDFVDEKLIQQFEIDNEIAYDEHNEYNPEDID